MTVLLALPVAIIVGVSVDWANAAAFLYGAGVGVLSFTSIAVAATLLGGRFAREKLLLGVVVYFGRLLFAVVAIGIPVFSGSWPVLPLVGGFAGVYVVENVLLLVGAWRVRGTYGRGAPPGVG